MTAFIPLRGGSKSIPGKNIKPIAGRPLVYWVLDAAVQCGLIDRVVVSTDDTAIRACVERYGHEKVEIVDRSPETATDSASTESAMLEYARTASFQDLVLIQATSPLLQAKHLQEGVQHYVSGGYDSLLSVVRQKRFIWKVDRTSAKPWNYDPAARPRRQDVQGFHVENGAFYVCSCSSLLASGSRLSGRIGAYEMPEDTYYELDEPADWHIIERLLLARADRSPSNGSASTGRESPPYDAATARALGRIKLFLTDVDGVLTDAGMYYSEHGDELKKFNTRDGKGLELLRKEGLQTGIITSEDTEIVSRRAEKLQVDHLFQGVTDKAGVLRKILQETGFSSDEVAFIGDDVNDLAILKEVGFAATPADGMPELHPFVDYICRKKGGEGCVREVAEQLLHVRRSMH